MKDVELVPGDPTVMLGAWKPAAVVGGRTVVVMFSCPVCGRRSFLGRLRVRDDGLVTPSLHCPCGDVAGFLRLAGWEQEVCSA